MLPSAKVIYKTLQPYLGKGYILCPDTNFLMNASEVFSKLKGEAVVVSRQVYNELDNLKSHPSVGNKDEKRRAFEAREGIRALDISQATLIGLAPPTIFQTYKLSNSPDDQIIASYLHYREDKQVNVLFLTLDRGAKMVAKSSGLETIDFDIDKFNKRRKKEQKLLNKYAHKRKLNPIQRMFFGMATIYYGLYFLIQFTIGFGFLLWVISLFLFPKHGYVADAKPVSLMDGSVTVTPTYIYQEDKDDSKKFVIYYEVKNNQEKTIRGFANPDRPLEFPEKQKEDENFYEYNNKVVEYDLDFWNDQMYVIFEGLEDENIFAGGLNSDVNVNERSTGTIEVKGDLNKLKELRTSLYIVDTKERIPYSIKINGVKEVKTSVIKDKVKELY